MEKNSALNLQQIKGDILEDHVSGYGFEKSLIE